MSSKPIPRSSFLPAFAAVLAVAAGFAVVPRTEEQTVMLMRDGDPRAGLALLAHHKPAEERPEIAMQAVRLNEAAGRVDAAIDGLAHYVSRWPDDEAALRKLADVAKSAMRPAPRIAALKRLVELKAKGPYAAELLGIYRQNGDTTGEMNLMSAQPGDPLWSAEDLERLGSMHAADGDEDAAIAAYRHADERASPNEHEGRFKLLRLLVKNNAGDEAVRVVNKWMPRWTNRSLAVEAASEFAVAGDLNRLVELAHALAADPRDLDLLIAEGLAKKGYRDAATRILQDGAARGRLSNPRRIEKFVDAALAAGDPSTPLAFLAKLLKGPGREKMAASLAELIASEFGSEVLAPLLPQLRVEVLAKRPLFGVNLALAGQNQALARSILLESRPNAVRDREAQDYAGLMFNLLGPELGLRRFYEMQKNGEPRLAMRIAFEEEGLKHGIRLLNAPRRD